MFLALPDGCNHLDRASSYSRLCNLNARQLSAWLENVTRDRIPQCDSPEPEEQGAMIAGGNSIGSVLSAVFSSSLNS